jgi:hypothetical protein
MHPGPISTSTVTPYIVQQEWSNRAAGCSMS